MSRCVAAVAFDQQQHEPAFDGWNQPALNREPALTELLRVLGGRQHRPH
jgi:hypothetical protein